MRSFKLYAPLFLAAALLLSTSSCDEQSSVTGPSGASGECAQGEAQLVVYDTFIQNLCGCQEPREEVFPPNSLTCTVSTGTTVLFWYLATNLPHQIQSTAQPTFPTSPLYDPNSSNPVPTHVVTLSAPGNYEFEDVYNRAINGTIIVQ